MLMHSPSLYAAAAVAVFLAGVASLAVAFRQRERRGVWCWALAEGLIALGLAVRAIEPEAASLVMFGALTVAQWPLLTLAGVRRFYSRGHDGIPGWVDWAVLGVVASVIGMLGVVAGPGIATQIVAAVAILAGLLYSALAINRLEDFTATPTLKVLFIGLLVAAGAEATWLVIALFVAPALGNMGDLLVVPLLATAALALLTTQLTLVMNHERNVAQLQATQRRLRRMVEVDSLTQLPNRAHFYKLAERAVKAQPENACVLVFDIDSLQKINELLGHSNGDEALKQVGTALRETLRRRDVAGRIGGDEFGVVLPRTKLADAEAVVGRINARIDDRQIAPRIVRIVLNAGGTQMRAGESVADAMRRAEITRDSSRDEGRLKLADTMPIERSVAPAANEDVANSGMTITESFDLADAEAESMAPTPALAYAMPMAQAMAIPAGEIIVV